MKKIAITTDTHYGYSPLGDKINLVMFQEIGDQKPDIILHCGDDSSHHPTQIDELWGKVRTIPELKDTPIFVTPGNHTCLSEDTELLTQRGWVTYKDISMQDKILSFDPSTNQGRWDKINKVFTFDAPGEMKTLLSSVVSMDITPDHRILYKPKDKTNWEYKVFDELPDWSVQIKTGCSLGLPDYPIEDCFIQACAWFVTDGSISRKNPDWAGEYIIYQSKPVENILAILNSCGFTYSVSTRDHAPESICGRRLKSHLISNTIRLYGDSALKMKQILPTKTLPLWVYQLSDRQFALFEEEVRKANGSMGSSNLAPSGNYKGYTLYGTQEALEQLQILYITHARRANLRQDTRGNWVLRVNYKEYSQINPKEIRGSRETQTGEQVWCLSVPLTNFMVRHRGVCFFTGNCWWAPQECPFTVVEEMIDHIHSLWKAHNITHLHGDISLLGDDLYIGAFDSWYHETRVPTNDWIMIPGVNGFDGEIEWRKLQKRSLDGFVGVIDKARSIKTSNPQSKILLMTHMGFIKADADSDWKAKNSGIYFGTTPQFEGNLEDFDYLFYGHSHRHFEGIATNGKTKILNVGSDYENPKYVIMEV